MGEGFTNFLSKIFPRLPSKSLVPDGWKEGMWFRTHLYFFIIGDNLIVRDFHSLSLNRNLVISYEVVVVGECLHMAVQNLLQSCKPWERLALRVLVTGSARWSRASSRGKAGVFYLQSWLSGWSCMFVINYDVWMLMEWVWPMVPPLWRGFLASSPVSEMPSWELPGDSRDADSFGWAPVAKPSVEKAHQT